MFVITIDRECRALVAQKSVKMVMRGNNQASLDNKVTVMWLPAKSVRAIQK
jgi:hypothetical protein